MNHVFGLSNFCDKYPHDFWKFWNCSISLPLLYSSNFKIFKNSVGQFIPNRPPKHVATIRIKKYRDKLTRNLEEESKHHKQVIWLIGMINWRKTSNQFSSWDHSQTLPKKKSSRNVLMKRCSENMQQMYKRTPAPKYAEVCFQHGCFSVNLLHISRTPFPKNTLGWLLLFSTDVFRTYSYQWKLRHT